VQHKLPDDDDDDVDNESNDDKVLKIGEVTGKKTVAPFLGDRL